jgi:hypothetical protein
MVILEPLDKTINAYDIGLMLLMHLTPICSCSGVHVFFLHKLFVVVLHKVLETLAHLSTREDIFHCSNQPFGSITMHCKHRRLSYSLA